MDSGPLINSGPLARDAEAATDLSKRLTDVTISDGEAGATPSTARVFHNPRKLSMISGTVPPCLKGVVYTMRLSGGGATVGRLSNVKVDALAALRAIGAEARARGLDADATAADLETCLAGFRAYCVARFACLIPIEVDDEAYRILYHDVKICGITRRCWRDDCAEVL